MKLLKFAFLSALTLSIAACKDNKPTTNKDESTITFKVVMQNENKEVLQNDTAHLANGYDVYVTLFRLYLSNIKAVKGDGTEVMIKDIALLDPGNGEASTFSAKLPFGNYTQIKLGFGLDSLQNEAQPGSFPNKDPRSTYQSMYWSMLKYRFVKFEGRAILRGGTTPVQIAYHTGTDALYQKRSYAVDLSSFDAQATHNISLILDLGSFFDGPGGQLDLSNENQTHSTVADIGIAQTFMENLAMSSKVQLDMTIQ